MKNRQMPLVFAAFLLALALIVPTRAITQNAAVLFGQLSGSPKAVTATADGYMNVAVTGGSFSGVTSGAATQFLSTTSVLGATSATAALAELSATRVVTGVADAVATTVFTVTIPNQSGSALLDVEAVASLGAGGAVGAFEASCGGRWIIAVTRVSGVAAAIAGASLAESTGSATSAGAATCTLARSFGAVLGAAGDPNTVTQLVTITRGSGSSTNHSVILRTRVLNSAANGITIS